MQSTTKLAAAEPYATPSDVPSPWKHYPSVFLDEKPEPAVDLVAARRTMPRHPASHPEQLAAWLIDVGAVIVSTQWLSELGVPSAELALARLREADLVKPSSTRGVYVLRLQLADLDVLPYDMRLACHLHAHPDSAATWGPRMVPIREGWVARRCSFTYNVPPKTRVPGCFSAIDQARVHRWEVKSPLLWYGVVPCWRYETEIVYIAARPGRYTLSEIHDYLWDLSHASVAEHLLAELDGQPRSVWMRTCLLLRYGCRRDLAEVLLAAAPPGKGPYYFLDGRSLAYHRRDRRNRGPIWHADLELEDFTVDFHLSVRTDRYYDLPEWAVMAYRSGRPHGYPMPDDLGVAGEPLPAELS